MPLQKICRSDAGKLQKDCKCGRYAEEMQKMIINLQNQNNSLNMTPQQLVYPKKYNDNKHYLLHIIKWDSLGAFILVVPMVFHYKKCTIFTQCNYYTSTSNIPHNGAATFKFCTAITSNPSLKTIG